jgi:hypothetical protein
VRALLRLATRPTISALTGDESGRIAAADERGDVLRLGEFDGLSLNRSKREEVGRVVCGIVEVSAEGLCGGGSIERPVIGDLNLLARLMLKAVAPFRDLLEGSGRMRGSGAAGVPEESDHIQDRSNAREWVEEEWLWMRTA